AGPQPYRGLPQRGTDCVSGNASEQRAEDSRHRHRTDHSRLPILDDGPAAPPSNPISLRKALLSLPRQERLGLPHFLPLGISILSEVYALAKTLRGLRSVGHRIGRACGTPESAVAVGRLLESGLVFLQRGRGRYPTGKSPHADRSGRSSHAHWLSTAEG